MAKKSHRSVENLRFLKLVLLIGNLKAIPTEFIPGAELNFQLPNNSLISNDNFGFL
jgi:hypothetical protein